MLSFLNVKLDLGNGEEPVGDAKSIPSLVSHRELSLCIRRSCPTAHAGGPGSPALRMDELKVRRPDSSMACSVSCGSYDATRKVSPTPTVPKKPFNQVRNLTINSLARHRLIIWKVRQTNFLYAQTMPSERHLAP